MPASVVESRQRTGSRVIPADALEPGPEHRLAVGHFLECAAVGRFPDDGWVRRHAMLLRPMLRRVEQAPIRDMAELLRLFLREVQRA
ncbi:MAG: hypothetical protein JNK93_16110 [Planctomycetia bacterium]|nr:hypothetical protein [Planctomycetia bacterium]